ncbi:MAG TPA: MFS transporter [Syntrophorhabdaceae bacterium]|nr:MFS transporter [Syntrophorhabdaceae bacterium]
MENNDSLKRNALLVASLSSFLTPFMGSSVNVSLPTMGRDLSMDAIALSWVATSYILSAAAFLVPFGRASDIYGRKKIFTWGIIIDNAASIFGALAPSGSILIFCRVLQGVGGAMIFGTGISMVTAVYPLQERGKALGIVLTTTYIGLAAGPFIGGFLTTHLGWRSIFLSNVVIGAVILTTTLWKIKQEWAEARGESLDLTGSVLYVFSLVLSMYGLSLLPRLIGLILVVPGVAGFVLFVFWVSKARYPVLDLHLFRHNRPFLFSNLAALINYSATFAVSFLLSLYLQYIMKFSPEHAGLILVVQPFVQAALSTMAGKISDRVEPRVLASAGMASLFVGLLFFAFLHSTSTLTYVVLDLALLGFGFALFIAPNTNAIMSSVERKSYGLASGIMATMRLVGQSLSMGVVMFTFMLHMGKSMITEENHPQFLQSMKISFLIFAALCLLGMFASLVRGKIRREEA